VATPAAAEMTVIKEAKRKNARWNIVVSWHHRRVGSAARPAVMPVSI
jgi:hypothetical protein